MYLLIWTFDWDKKCGHATSPLGRYSICVDEQKRWTAKFHKNGDVTTVIKRNDQKHTLDYDSLGDAIRACQRHCDGHSSDRSGRMSYITPLPIPQTLSRDKASELKAKKE